MDTNTAMLLAVIPAALVVLATVIAENAGPRETAHRRVFLLLETATLGMLVFLLGLQFLPPSTGQPLFWVAYLFIPVLFGLAALTLSDLPRLRGLEKKETCPLILLGLVNMGMIAYLLREQGITVLAEVAPPVILTLLVAWLARRRPSGWVWALAGVAAVLWLPYHPKASAVVLGLSAVPRILLGVSVLSAPVVAVAAMSLLTHSGIHLLRSAQNRSARFQAVARLLAALLLLALVVLSAFWTSVWDQTTDGLGGLMIASMVAVTAVACGMVMSLRASGWGRLVGMLFAAAVTLAIQTGFRAGWDANFKTMTEQRAARIAAGLDRFYQREDRYPQRLNELFPRDLLYVPGPVMFQSEDWCYQGTASAYRLAAFFHEYFGAPVSLKVYASAGAAGRQPLPCAERLAAMQTRYDWTNNPMTYPAEPTPTPSAAQLAQMGTPIPREPLAPIFPGPERILPGEWSADGRWWYFRVPQPGEKQARLYFLDVPAGRVCPVEQTFPYTIYGSNRPGAWLPGDRLLYVDGSQNALILTPCQAGAQELSLPGGATLSGIFAVAPGSGWVALQSADAYWLWRADQEEPRLIAGVQPPGFEAHWDHAAWASGGTRLAISHLNGRETQSGMTLYLIDAETAQVTGQWQMERSAEQSAPFIEWVSEHELLTHAQGSQLLLDFRANPPRQMDVMKDLFGLDLAFPDQVSSSASLLSRDGGGYHLAVWANHARNRNLYVYHSENGGLSVYQPQSQAVLIFADGQWVAMTQIEDPGQAQDILSVYWVDTTRAALDIPVRGHLPRGYPRLDVRYLPERSRLLLGSSNGVSLVSLPEGNLLGFWQTGAGGGDLSLSISPDGRAGLAIVEGEGVFQIPLGE